jgi:guanosine-3',5'-bis(diphosphate) 3'-pyrophosphohydrolase
MDKLYQDLLQKLESSGRTYDLEKIKKGYELAKTAHEGQMRDSGDIYLTHPVSVAVIVIDLGLDTDSIIAALLHDVVEDTNIELAMIEKLFGSDIASLVDGLTKLRRIHFSTREEQQVENIRKMLLAMSKDIRVILIKLADRLHNMRTLDCRSDQKRRDTALTTMEVYAPIAHRLGIRTIKEELEDLSLRHLDPIAYGEIEVSLERRKDEREAFLQSIQERINERFVTNSVHVHIEGRVKSIYGIYRKIYLQNRSFDEIYDVYAVRIIVDTVNECYNILGIIHDMMHPIPGRFKDYISTPKPNMYQSLHTTVIGKEGIPFEVQIRTWEMHQTAEYGIAAHWKYKLGMSGKDIFDKKLDWVRQLLEVQKDAKDAEDFMRSFKTDLAPDEVFLFTPKGDVINLPLGSTPIDFAYAIHSAVGNRMTGAKVNGKIEQLGFVLKTGDIVEVITTASLTHGPSRDWIKIVKTSEARNKIRAWFKKERREENIEEGKIEFEKEFKRNGISLSAEQYEEFALAIAKRQHFNNSDEFYAAIGYGGFALSKIMPRVKEEYQKIYRPIAAPVIETSTKKSSPEGIIVEGLGNCLVKLSQCCNPLPGDSIIGFITRGFGVSVHKSDCTNIVQNIKNAEYDGRFVKVHWADTVDRSFKAGLQIAASDRRALLADITAALASMHVMIHSVNAREIKTGDVLINITIDAENIDHLQSVITRLGKVEGVFSVSRGVN